MQSRHIALPRYVVVSTEGAAHKQKFEVECVIDGVSAEAADLLRRQYQNAPGGDLREFLFHVLAINDTTCDPRGGETDRG